MQLIAKIFLTIKKILMVKILVKVASLAPDYWIWSSCWCFANKLSKENKPISERLAEHFGFRVNSDGNVDNVEDVCCVNCHKSS